MRRRARQAILVALLSLIGAGSSVAQTPTSTSTSTITPPPSALPANWQQLSATDFATLVQGYLQQGTFQTLNPVDQASLATQGASLFSQQNIATTTLPYQTLETLAAVGQSQLDQWSMASANSAIMARSDNWAGLPYAAMKAKVRLMGRLNVPDPVAFREAHNWVLAGGTQAQVPANDFVYDFARQMFADAQVIDRSFSVSWAAQLNAPQSGDYTFFISPIDLNSGFSNPSANVSMTVLVAGQAIITATPPTPPNPLSPAYQPGARPTSNWVASSNPITLTAGTPVSVQVNYSVESPQTLPAGALHAMLFWQGPGITQQLVPTSAVSQAQTGAPGFQATYAWTAKGQQQSLTRTDPMIDFAWTNSSLILAQDPTSTNQAAANMWQAMTATSFINTYANATPVPSLHPFLAEPQDASCGLSTANRQAFLDLLIQNPTLLDAMDAPHAVAFFQAFRVGAPDKALNVFGTWATRQADLACTLANGRFFDADTRLSLAAMAIMTTQQLPTQAATLQQQFLQTPDGRCSLPVAYTLSYSNLGLGNLSNWASTLDATLANAAITGDLRVNWLMARAHAVEFTRTAPLHYPFKQPYPSSWPIDGNSYVYQALQAAQSPAVKVRVAKDMAARMTSAGDYQKAIDLLSQLSNSLPAAQQATVTAWQQQIAGYVALQSQVLQAQQAEWQKAYLMTLTARRDQATSQGDTASVNRYNALISAASGQQ
jgi:hypothetical protein